MPVLHGKEALVKDSDHCCLGKEKGDNRSFLFVHVFCSPATSALSASSVMQKYQDWSLEAAPQLRGPVFWRACWSALRLPLPLLLGLGLGFLGDSVRSCPL